jgi:hypothetical protein
MPRPGSRTSCDQDGLKDDVADRAARVLDRLFKQIGCLSTHLEVADPDRCEAGLHEIHKRHVVMSDH